MRNTGPPPVTPLHATLIDAPISDFGCLPQGLGSVEFECNIFEISADRLSNQRLPRLLSESFNSGGQADGDVSMSRPDAGGAMFSSRLDRSRTACGAGPGGGVLAGIGRWCGEEPPGREPV
jgi:hypothetical protein